MIKINENYSVDDAGNIHSRPRPGTAGGVLKPTLTPKGYLVVMLSPSRVPIKVHRLVANAFIPNPLNKPEVNHKDGNKTNNAASNLEWVTPKENSSHAKINGLLNPATKENHPSSKLTQTQVDQIRSSYVPRNRTYGVRALARKYNVAHTSILDIIHGRTWV